MANRFGFQTFRAVRYTTAAATMLVLGACAVNPVTQKRELSLLGEEQELRMGEEAYPLYTQMSEGLFADAELQAYVQSVGQKLARVSHRSGLDYRYNVVNSSEINAYALPGGKISLTRGLLSKMESEAELAAVLGHETGHVTARHAAAGYTRQVLAGLLTTVGAAVLQTARVQGGELLAQGGMIAANLVLMKYSRDQERQADELGMEYMTAAGYNPLGMVRTMETLMESQKKEPSAAEAMFRSHPLSSERVATAQTLLGQQDRKLLTEAALRTQPFQQATQRLRATAPAYAKMDLGRKALEEKKDAEALRLLTEAAALAPDQALIWVYRAAAESRNGKKEAAFESAERAVALYPDLFHARFNAGVTGHDVKKYRESLAHLDAADKLVPGQPQVAFFRGKGYEALEDRDAAAKQYAQVLKGLDKGPMAEYSQKKLAEWGYSKQQPAPQQGR